MKHYLRSIFALLAFTLLTSASALAQSPEKVIIALETGTHDEQARGDRL